MLTILPSLLYACITLFESRRKAYKAYIFVEISELKLSFQSSIIPIVSAREKIMYLLGKIEFWWTRVENMRHLSGIELFS
jgi:hypothetical protein